MEMSSSDDVTAISVPASTLACGASLPLGFAARYLFDILFTGPIVYQYRSASAGYACYATTYTIRSPGNLKTCS